MDNYFAVLEYIRLGERHFISQWGVAGDPPGKGEEPIQGRYL